MLNRPSWGLGWWEGGMGSAAASVCPRNTFQIISPVFRVASTLIAREDPCSFTL